MEGCLPADDFAFPTIYSPNTPDRSCRVAGIDGPAVGVEIAMDGALIEVELIAVA